MAGTGGDNWCDIERQVLYSLIVDGEALVEFGARNGTLCVRVRDAQTLDPYTNAVGRNGTVVRMGIERDAQNEPVAYHFQEPTFVGGAFGNESYHIGGTGFRTERVPADRILHIFDRSIPGTTRGVPWIVPATISAELLRHYTTSAMIAARTSANLYAVMTKSDGEVGDFDTEDRKEFGREAKLKAAGILVAPEGYGVDVTTPTHPTGTYEPFTNSTHRQIAASVGIAAHTLDGNLAGINFSAGRIGAMNERETYGVIRQMIADGLHDRVFAKWLPFAYLTGLPGRMDELSDVAFVAKGFDHIQPGEQATADKINIELRLKSLSEVIRDRGEDPADVFKQIADDQAALKKMGLKYPSSSGGMGGSGEMEGGAEGEGETDEDDDPEMVSKPPAIAR